MRTIVFLLALGPGITLQLIWMCNKVIRIETLCDRSGQAPDLSPTVREAVEESIRMTRAGYDPTETFHQLPVGLLPHVQEEPTRTARRVRTQTENVGREYVAHQPRKRKRSKSGRSEQRKKERRQAKRLIEARQSVRSLSEQEREILQKNVSLEEESVRLPGLRPSLPTHYIPYHVLAPRINDNVTYEEENSYSAYGRAIKKSVPGTKLCKETCCVESVAISLDQDTHKIVNTEDGKDLADIRIIHNNHFSDHLPYFASHFKEDMIPCMLPGTIIHIDNHRMSVNYFWYTVRPKIKVPFVLMTTASDDDTPCAYEEYLADPLLIKWYGTNPLRHMPGEYPNKVVPMHLGTSYQHPQMKYLKPYLEINNYTNPFANMDRFDLGKYPLDWDKDVIVHFGLDRDHRIHLWKLLCPEVSNSAISCNNETHNLRTTDIYAGMSQHRFGISPTGLGWDCYRTYEMLLVGVIPIITERMPDSHALFEDLPVIQMPNLDWAQSKEDLVQAIESYFQSPQFLKANFTAGWERLFTKHQRRQLLRDTGRDREILTNKKGQEFYQAYRYTTTEPQTNVFCENRADCPYEDRDNIDQLTKWEKPKLQKSEKAWLKKWLKRVTPPRRHYSFIDK